ncbi:glycosyltransferase family 4 protein [Neobacillus cucumis]|uniref:Glycosyl transferase family 1 domain-containing protein n=1 Tax=Neobacillus cucumis TaxID=1740721 RepID=A0A2N5H7L9_9BACI|nr:glycosyltransferase family 4 protein [Neobacillus cucumis]PLS01516.1 hypothetical protein CVD27_24995 [Neobacillus cucumis]
MRVGFYNHTSEISGAEISMLLTAKNLSVTTPVIFAPEGELIDRAIKSKIQVVKIKSYRARLSKNPFQILKGILGTIYGGYQVSKAIKTNKIDLVHANSLRAGIMASIFIFYHKVPVIWHVRDIPPKGLVGKLITFLGEKTIKALIGISQPVIEGISSISLKNKSYLIHNGVKIEKKEEVEKERLRKKIRNEFNTPLNSKVIVVVGQIAPWKRQEDAIKSAKTLFDKGEDVYLWVVGEAKFRDENVLYKDNLVNLVQKLGLKNRVVFTGFRNDVIDICCASDILLLCSNNEPFGRVIIEGMSQGVPVIATNSGGVPEIIKDKYNGLLYEVGDVKTLSDNILHLLKDQFLCQNIIINAENSVKQSFTIQRTSQKVEEVYRIVTSM